MLPDLVRKGIFDQMDGHGETKRFKVSDPSELNFVESNNNRMATTSSSPSTSASGEQPGGQQQQQNGRHSHQEQGEQPSCSTSSSLQLNGVKENEVEAGTPEMTALSKEKILETTLRNFSVAQLKKLRVVSKQWDSTSIRILQEKLDPLTFTDEFYDAEKMLKLLQTFRQRTDDSLHVKFEIASKFFTELNEDLIKDFFRTCGPFMQHLTVCTDRNMASNVAFVEELLKELTLPKLKFLVFEDHTPGGSNVNNSEGGGGQDFSKFYKAVISAATNLERLDLSFRKRYFDSEDEDAMAQLHQMPDGIICSKSSEKLKHLEISAKITDSQLLALAECGLNLKTLHFRVKNVSLMQSSFTELLKSQGESLVELKLTEERHGSNFIVKFPRMNKLRRITITSICEFENSIVTFSPLGYQEDLPQLDNLVLWNCFGKEDRWSQFFLASSPSLTMNKLELPTQFRNTSLARNISTVFPQLKRLKIGFSLRPENEDVMKIIFETLTSLEELDIRTDMDEMNENIDHVLTGIPKNVCKEIKQNQAFLDPHCLDQVERNASLVDLSNLKRLDIVLDNNRAPFITDVTGYLAFLRMPKLKFLRFTRYGMSQECVDKLLEKYTVSFIPPHGRNFFEVEYINFDDFD